MTVGSPRGEPTEFVEPTEEDDEEPTEQDDEEDHHLRPDLLLRLPLSNTFTNSHSSMLRCGITFIFLYVAAQRRIHLHLCLLHIHLPLSKLFGSHSIFCIRHCFQSASLLFLSCRLMCLNVATIQAHKGSMASAVLA